MTTQQPEALRLAYAICDYSRYGFESEQLAKLRRMKANTEAAAELRRLHESNQELLEALKECIHFVEYDPKNVIGKQAKAAIAKAERTTP